MKPLAQMILNEVEQARLTQLPRYAELLQADGPVTPEELAEFKDLLAALGKTPTQAVYDHNALKIAGQLKYIVQFDHRPAIAARAQDALGALSGKYDEVLAHLRPIGNATAEEVLRRLGFEGRVEVADWVRSSSQWPQDGGAPALHSVP